MNTGQRQHLTNLMTRTATPTLITSLRALSAPNGQEEVMARAWTIDELERRFPAAAKAVEAAFEAAENAGTDVDYVAVLLAHIPTAGATP